jgi:hypothetical protein
MVRFLVKLILKYDITCVLWPIVFETQVTVQWHRVSNEQTMAAQIWICDIRKEVEISYWIATSS